MSEAETARRARRTDRPHGVRQSGAPQRHQRRDVARDSRRRWRSSMPIADDPLHRAARRRYRCLRGRRGHLRVREAPLERGQRQGIRGRRRCRTACDRGLGEAGHRTDPRLLHRRRGRDGARVRPALRRRRRASSRSRPRAWASATACTAPTGWWPRSDMRPRARSCSPVAATARTKRWRWGWSIACCRMRSSTSMCVRLPDLAGECAAVDRRIEAASSTR